MNCLDTSTLVFYSRMLGCPVKENEEYDIWKGYVQVLLDYTHPKFLGVPFPLPYKLFIEDLFMEYKVLQLEVLFARGQVREKAQIRLLKETINMAHILEPHKVFLSQAITPSLPLYCDLFLFFFYDDTLDFLKFTP